ncbi:hypothetical protein Cni_G11833 [Canna indica]|uniref:Glycoside hydrolase family 3 N-terminal domain-containing protein n=1 Tax=Canna indica TaxID=4628 RepID=A0AAQ3K9J5_9LILI|nr:hypothetical protein Cni_G11833 [Canna indica]
MGTFKNLIIMLVVLYHSSVKGGAEYFKYKDPNQPLNTRINDLLSRMTLAEKIGQMTQVERQNATAEVIKNYFIGSVLNGGGSVPAPQASVATWVSMITEMQKAALSTRLGIPIIYGVDAVHGHNNVYKATIFPHNIGLGATRDPALVRKIGAATALEVRATGIQYVFAPCVAVCRDPRWGRCYESYSEDPKVVEEMTEIIDGLQGTIPANSRKGVPFVAGKKNVAACAKHYVGDGGTTKGINENNTVIDQHGLLSIHMPPYYHAIIKGVSTVMVSYSSWNGVKMHANRHLITDFLKNTLRFRGFVISDWEGIDKITSPPHANYSYSITAAISAGIDMIMGYSFTEFITDLTYQVEKNIIPMSRIDDAVRRILRVKFTMGLFEGPYPDPSLAEELGKQEHRELAREAVRKSLVLLKNGKAGQPPVLPLPKKTKSILVTGSHADNLGYQCGGWTMTWQGLSGNNLTVVKGGAEYFKYKDPNQPLNTRINDLLSRMTLAEKIGQMTQIERQNATAEVIENYFIGSVLSGGGSVPAPQASVATWVSMVTEMQKAALSTRLGIPIIYGIDAVHGHNNVYKATIFPHNIGLGATRDPALVRKIGTATALEVRATGIPYVFAPCVAVCRDPRWGRCYESYSEDPKVVEEMTEIINGLQGTIPSNSQKGVPFIAGKNNVAACAKHYVGDGGTTKGINENNTGFVISDWQGIDRITSPPHANYSYSIMAGISAGIDMIMVPYGFREFITDLTYQVEKNLIPMSRIDDAVRRILRVKFTMGLFENPYPDPSLVEELGKQEHRELAREAVRKSLVLLKNGKAGQHPVLPLPKKTESILVTGSHADNLGYQCGGWTITWQGLGGNNLTVAAHESYHHIFEDCPFLSEVWCVLVGDGSFGDCPFALDGRHRFLNLL